MWIPRVKPISRKRMAQLVRDHGDKSYQDFRKKVLERDNYMCQFVGCKSKIKLEVHHIKRFVDAKHLKTDPFNGITLCKKCHRSISQKEQQYELFFLKIALTNQEIKDKGK